MAFIRNLTLQMDGCLTASLVVHAQGLLVYSILHQVFSRSRLCSFAGRFGAVDVTFLSMSVASLSRNTHLAKLSLDGTLLGVQGAVCLKGALVSNSTLVYLSLAECDLGCSGAKVIADLLFSNSVLLTLDLARNHIGPAGAHALASAIFRNHTLAHLYLQGNSIGSQGAAFFSSSLFQKASLQLLDLSDNLIGLEGARELCASLHQCRSLTDLRLASNDFGVDGARRLYEALCVNQSITSIDLSSIGTGSEDVSLLENGLIESGNWRLLRARGAEREAQEFCTRNSLNRKRALSVAYALAATSSFSGSWGPILDYDFPLSRMIRRALI
jgi:Ran GTPase-activating protein (RanGAP) involved in mRNA processing and transport